MVRRMPWWQRSMSTSCMRFGKQVIVYVLQTQVFMITHFQAIPFADKFIFEDGKHNLHLKYKDQFNALVSDFLAK